MDVGARRVTNFGKLAMTHGWEDTKLVEELGVAAPSARMVPGGKAQAYPQARQVIRKFEARAMPFGNGGGEA